MVLARHRLVIFVHGCFWHRHPGCRYATTPASNAEFWNNKFEQNVARDRRNAEELRSSGWRVATVWECAFRKHGAAAVADTIERWLDSTSDILEIGEDPL
jgi:DNA mismatch endonuclease (patch repair protein)